MQKFISANVIFTVDSNPIEMGVLALATDGTILQVLTREQAKGIPNVQHFVGAFVPGFINTHCHLELSHMKGLINEHTGLPNFIKQILAQRQHPEDEIISAMQIADEEMYRNGIVAIGDISNQLVSKSVKAESKIYYHTFVELFGFNRPSEPIIEAGIKLKADYAPLKASIVPHAPYSVSSSLFEEINRVTQSDDILSIHNQETLGEGELFETGTGAFADFFADMGIAQNETHNTGINSIQYHLPQLPKNVNTLLVHNTFTNKADLDFAKTQHDKLYWCLCPNANLYIENNLPDADLLLEQDVKVTLGTDSLASNHGLNILAEMQTLQEQKNISFTDLLNWATLNGAKFLEIDAQYGSLSVGKKPGINLIQLDENYKIINTQVKKLF